MGIQTCRQVKKIREKTLPPCGRIIKAIAVIFQCPQCGTTDKILTKNLTDTETLMH
jgi:predicted RNA-binding Zn-ribbon protein involved in translation (DUF1610 family)